MAVAAMHAPVRAAAVAASMESTTLPRLQLSVAEYGLGVPSIVVYAAAEPKRLQAAGAALAVGPAPAPAQDQAAESFFEDLLRRGRLKVARAGKPAAEVVRSSAPLTHETHTHELRREGRQMGAAPGSHRLRGLARLRTHSWGLYDARGEFGGQKMVGQCRASRKSR